MTHLEQAWSKTDIYKTINKGKGTGEWNKLLHRKEYQNT